MLDLHGRSPPVALSVYRPLRTMPLLSTQRRPLVVLPSLAPTLWGTAGIFPRASKTATDRSDKPTPRRREGAGVPTPPMVTRGKSPPAPSPLPSIASGGAVAPYYLRHLPVPRRSSVSTLAYNVARSPVMPISASTSFRPRASGGLPANPVPSRVFAASTLSTAVTTSARRTNANVVNALPVSQLSSRFDQSRRVPASMAPNRKKLEQPETLKPRLSQTSAQRSQDAPSSIPATASPDTLAQQQTDQPWSPPPLNENDAPSGNSDATELHLDGHVLGQWMLDHLEGALSRPPATPNFITGHGLPGWPGESPFS